MHLARLLIAFIAACAVSASALAQLRNIPGDAKRGEMRHLQAMVVEIDGVPQRLAPGAQIRDASNRVIVPTAVTAGTPVKYVVNGQGLVHQVWILTPEEAAKR
jgi:hypothetical protein